MVVPSRQRRAWNACRERVILGGAAPVVPFNPFFLAGVEGPLVLPELAGDAELVVGTETRAGPFPNGFQTPSLSRSPARFNPNNPTAKVQSLRPLDEYRWR